MKKIIIFAILGLGLAGCAPVALDDAQLVKNYQKLLTQSQSCAKDSDCVAVSKGCCPCDGQVAVNKKYASNLAKRRHEACGVVPCTLQMCYEEINVSCQNKVCTGAPKPHEAYYR